MQQHPSGSERELCARFARLIPDQVNADRHLVWRGRTLTADCLIQIGSAALLLRVDAGSIRECRTELPPLCPWDLAVRGSAQAWAALWQDPPPPGWHDIFALSKRGEMSLRGQPSALPGPSAVFQGRAGLASRRGRVMAQRRTGTDRRALRRRAGPGRVLQGLLRRGGTGYTVAVPAYRGSRLAAVPPPDVRRSGHAPLPGHRVRPALARQVISARRLAGVGIPLDHADAMLRRSVRCARRSRSSARSRWVARSVDASCSSLRTRTARSSAR